MLCCSIQRSSQLKSQVWGRVGWEKERPASGTLPAGAQVPLALEQSVLHGSKDLTGENNLGNLFLKHIQY